MKISVIIPVYNKIHYLSGLLEQVMGQTFTDFECLLIDDGSTDGSGVVCDEFAARDARFRVFHIPNGGVSHARNVGLDAAQGEYITFIDSDDRIRPELLERLRDHAEESGADMVIGNLEKVWGDRNSTEPLPLPYNGQYTMEELLPVFASVQQSTGIYGFSVAKLLRRDLIAETRFDCGIRLAEDLSFYLDIYPRVNSIYFDPVPCYGYLQAAENSSMLDADDRIDYFTQLLIQLKLLRFLSRKNVLVGENRRIMLSRIYDFVFFSLFHCKLRNYRRMCTRIRALELPNRYIVSKEMLIRRTILFLYDRGMDSAAITVLAFYRLMRSCIRMIRKGDSQYVNQASN